MTAKRVARFNYQPVGLDLWSPGKHGLAKGALVVKTQPAGVPKNGTMGHTFVADAVTGQFIGMVLTASLVPAGYATPAAPKRGRFA